MRGCSAAPRRFCWSTRAIREDHGSVGEVVRKTGADGNGHRQPPGAGPKRPAGAGSLSPCRAGLRDSDPLVLFPDRVVGKPALEHAVMLMLSVLISGMAHYHLFNLWNDKRTPPPVTPAKGPSIHRRAGPGMDSGLRACNFFDCWWVWDSLVAETMVRWMRDQGGSPSCRVSFPWSSAAAPFGTLARCAPVASGRTTGSSPRSCADRRKRGQP